MAFTRVQGSGKLQYDGVTGTQTFGSWSGSNFVVGNLVLVEIVHYADPPSDVITGVTVNGTAATKRGSRTNPTNNPNQVEIWECVVVTGGARSVAISQSGAGTNGGGHFGTLAIAEYSFTGTLSVVGSAVTADGNSTGPSVSTPSGTAIGDLIVAVMVVADGGSRTITPPGSYTQEFNEGDSNNHEGGSGVTRIAAAGGTQAVTWSSSSSHVWSAVVVVYNSTGGSGVTSAVAASTEADVTAAVASSEAIPSTVAGAVTGDFAAAVSASQATPGTVAAVITTDLVPAVTATVVTPITSTVAGVITSDVAASISALHTVAGAFNGIVYGDSLAGTSGISGAEAMASRLQVYRPSDTWDRVSFGALMIATALDSGSGQGFEQAVHDVHFQPGERNLVIFWSILHGDANDTSDSANTIFDRYVDLVDLAHSFGWEVAATTIPATTEYNDPGGSPYRRPQRIAINDLLRNGDGGSRLPRAGAEYLIDVETISGLGQNDVPDSGPPGGTLIQTDGIHLTAAGQDAVAVLSDEVLDDGNASAVAASVASDFSAAVTSAQTFPSSVAAAITSDFTAAASAAEAIPSATAATIAVDFAAAIAANAAAPGSATIAAEITTDIVPAVSSTETIPSALAADDIAASFTAAASSAVAAAVTSSVAAAITDDLAVAVTSAEAVPASVAAVFTDDLTPAVASGVAAAVTSTVAAVVTNDFAASATVTHTTAGDSVLAAAITSDIGSSVAALQTIPSSVVIDIASDFSAASAALLDIQATGAAAIANDFAASVAALESVPSGVVIDITDLLVAAAAADVSTETTSSVASVITGDFSAGINSLMTVPVDGSLAIDVAGDFVAAISVHIPLAYRTVSVTAFTPAAKPTSRFS